MRDNRLDFLRGGAMLYVIGVGHLHYYSNALNYNNSVTHLLNFCVLGLFVFLSGFLLSSRYVIAGLSDVRRFYLRRLSRIYPMYMLVSLCFLIVGASTRQQALKGLVGLNMFTGTQVGTIWFVELICIFYVLTPVLLWHSTTRKMLLTGAVLSCAFALGTYLTHGAVNWKLALFFPVFTIGAGVARVKQAEIALTGKPALACAIVALPVLWWVIGRSEGIVCNIAHLAAMIAFLPLAFSVAGFVTKRISPGIFRNIAYVSFAMYLLHRLTGRVVVYIYRPTSLLSSVIYLYGFWITVTYLLSWAFQRSYDYTYKAVIGNRTAT